MELFNILNIKPEEYFLSGSRGMDTDTCKISTDESDYDYVVLIFNKHIIIDFLNKNNIQITPSDYNDGFYFTWEGKTVNIISKITVEFMAWREALLILKLLIAKDVMYQRAVKNKFSRYCLYEQLRGLVKTTIRLGEFNG